MSDNGKPTNILGEAHGGGFPVLPPLRDFKVTRENFSATAPSNSPIEEIVIRCHYVSMTEDGNVLQFVVVTIQDGPEGKPIVVPQVRRYINGYFDCEEILAPLPSSVRLH